MEANQTSFLNLNNFLPFIRYAILLILFLYAIFALIIVRQVDLMSKTLITPVSPIVRAVSILHGGFAVSLLILTFITL